MSRKFNVVVLDDNEVDQMVYQRQLQRSERFDNVFSFYDAEEALDFLSQEDREQIDVILLDINMPKIDGFEFLERANASDSAWFSNAIVVMLTTSASPYDKRRATAYPVIKDFLTKPLNDGYIERIIGMIEE